MCKLFLKAFEFFFSFLSCDGFLCRACLCILGARLCILGARLCILGARLCILGACGVLLRGGLEPLLAIPDRKPLNASPVYGNLSQEHLNGYPHQRLAVLGHKHPLPTETPSEAKADKVPRHHKGDSSVCRAQR